MTAPDSVLSSRGANASPSTSQTLGFYFYTLSLELITYLTKTVPSSRHPARSCVPGRRAGGLWAEGEGCGEGRTPHLLLRVGLGKERPHRRGFPVEWRLVWATAQGPGKAAPRLRVLSAKWG